MYAKPIQKLIASFSKLPTVGNRTAERFVFHLLKSGKKDVSELIIALKNLVEQVRSCSICWDFSDSSPCQICHNEKRDKNIVCVVSSSQDVQAMEKIGNYQGVYHILRGTLHGNEENSLENLKIAELIIRLQNSDVKEIILALNPDLSGETTMLYLEKTLKKVNPNLIISRLARGLPMGSDLQYADEITLENALKNRVKL